MITSRAKPRPMSRSARLAALLLAGTALAALPVSPANADDLWTGATSTDWFTGSNWSNNAAPTSTDIVYMATTTPNATIINGGNAVSGFTSVGGQSGPGQLTISGGGTLTPTDGLSVGNSVTPNAGAGLVLVTGAGSQIIAPGSVVSVGDGSDGTLTINKGAAVNALSAIAGSQSNGTINVDGAGSTLTGQNVLEVNAGIGGNKTGILSITNGATAISNDGTFIGEGLGTATATVDGAGSSMQTANQLTIGAGGTGTLNIQNGGLVSDTNASIGSKTSGIGSVVVTGAGSNWTTSNFLSVGGDLAHGSGTGSLTISNGGKVSAGSFSLALNANSIGTLNIGAAPGETAAGAGTLDTPFLNFGSGTGTINFNHTSTNYLFAPSINGAGIINQIAGTTILTTDSLDYSGAVNVTGGQLFVNGSMTGALATVSSGGLLGGIGTVGGIVAQSGGIIAPGHLLGTLNVAGNVTQAAGSTLQVEVISTGTSALLKASGTATIASGAQLNVVQFGAGPYVVGTQYTVLEADGGVTGTYTLTGDLGTFFLGLTDSYDATHVYLDVVQRSFASVGTTPNQVATGTGAESLGSGNPVYDAIEALPTAAAAQAAFDQLSGEIHASAKGMLLDDSHFIRDAATSRIDAAFGDASGAALPVMAYGDGGPEIAAADTDRFAVWGQAFGSWGNTDSDGNAAAFDRSTGGLLAGADTLVGAWRVGVLGGYSHSSFNVDARNSAGSSDSYHLGLYGGTNWGAIAFRGGAAYSWSRLATNRSVAFNGFADQLTANYDAGTAQAFGELAYKVEANKFAFEPFANLAYVDEHTDGFSESGGEAALSSAATNTDATFTTLGLRGSTDIALGGIDATARGMLGWRHAFGDVTPTSSFAFAGGDAFTIAGVPIARDAAVIEAGFDLKMAANATLGLSYSGQFGSGATDNGAKADLSVKF